MSTNQQVIQRYLKAFGERDFKTVRSLLHDDFKFQGPLMTSQSADEFMAGIKMLEETLVGIDLMGTAQDGAWVGSYYILKTRIPKLERTTTSEWFRLEDGKIKASYLVFDATEWRKVSTP